MWERKLMVQLDRNEKVIEWGSEEIIIPYRSPLDGKVHRYFPDFYAKIIAYDGSIKKLIIEVKPKSQTRPPKSNPKRKTKAWAFAVKEYAKNQHKAQKYLSDICKNFFIFNIID